MTPTAPAMLLKLIWQSIITDRVVVTGTTTGAGTLGAAKVASRTMADHVIALQPYLVFCATILGALVSLATLVYVVIKIYRLLKNPAALG